MADTLTVRNVYDCVLPLEETFSTDFRWSLRMRVVPAYEPAREWFLVFTRNAAGEAGATLRTPKHSRIIQTFRKLEEETERPTCGQLKELVAFTECRIDSRELPALGPLADELEAQRWPAVPNQGLVFDATSYEANVQTLRERVHLRVQGPSRQTTLRDWHPLISWAERVHATLSSACK